MKKTKTFHPRLTPAMNDFSVWLTGAKFEPCLIAGAAGCGKTQFAEDYLDHLGLNFLYVTVPDEGTYIDTVTTTVMRYQSAYRDAVDTSERLRDADICSEKHALESKQLSEMDVPYLIIDEGHRFVSELENGAETFQHSKKSLSIGDVKIPYNRIIFISHKPLGRNNSENTRFNKILIPSPSRHEIVDVLMSLGHTRQKSVWSASHSKANFRSAINVSHAYGTDAQTNHSPRGLNGQDIDILWYYFRTDPAVLCGSIPLADKLPPSTNYLGNCAAFLGLDVDAIRGSEADLKEEKLLAITTQSRRVLPTNPENYKTVLAVLKLAGKFGKPEAKPDAKPEPEQAQTQAQSSKPKAKAKAKAKSKPKAKKALTSSVSTNYNEFRNSIEIPTNPLDKLDN